MSSIGNTHWCHQCMQPIRVRGRIVACPHCSDGFVQELDEVVGTTQQEDFTGLRSDGWSGYGSTEPLPLADPRLWLMDRFSTIMRQRMAESRPRSGLVPEHSMASGSRPWFIFQGQPPVRLSEDDVFDFIFNENSRTGQMPVNFGESFVGPGLEELIEQLTMNDRQGPPPAPRSSIESMPTIRISQRHLNTDSHCPVCQDKFELGCEAKQMPCEHIYHSDCILPWLVQHNSCPVCRIGLPPPLDSGGARSNLRLSGRNGSTSGGSSGGNIVWENGRSTQGRRRRNPFSFLWPF